MCKTPQRVENYTVVSQHLRGDLNNRGLKGALLVTIRPTSTSPPLLPRQISKVSLGTGPFFALNQLTLISE